MHQELAETLLHVLWELVQVFSSIVACSRGARPGARTNRGVSLLYPFSPRSRTTSTRADDVRRSVLLKAEEVGALREQTLTDPRVAARRRAEAVRRAFAGRAAAGPGQRGSATDAWTPWRLTTDGRSGGGASRARSHRGTAILTALINESAPSDLLAEFIAHGRGADVLLAISTSGGSATLLAACARRAGGTGHDPLVGYAAADREQRLADH